MGYPMKDESKKGWFELTANFCPKFGEKIQRLGRSIFTTENMILLEDILKQAEHAELNPETAETIKYIWWGVRRLTEVFPDGSKK